MEPTDVEDRPATQSTLEYSEPPSPGSAACILDILQPPQVSRRLVLEDEDVTFGRDAACGVQLDFPDVSRLHARLRHTRTGWVIEDCGSKNGVFVNGERAGRHDMRDGDTIRIGAVECIFGSARLSFPSADLAHVAKLLDVSKAMSSSLVPEEVLERIIDSVASISGAERAFLMLRNGSGELEFKVARNIDRKAVEGSDFRISRTVANECARSGTPVVIENVPEDEATASIEALGLKAVACFPLVLNGRVLGVLYTDSRRPSWIRQLDTRILESLASHAAVSIENARLSQEHKEALYNTAMALAEAIDARDTYTAGHSRRVTEYSLRIGRALGLSGEDLDILRIGSILHDIGKIGISDSVLRKPSKLEVREYEAAKRHPEIGARILAHVPQLARVVPAVRHHHERVDGQGYPDGLAGDRIPILARIIAVADTFDAMTSGRVYRSQLQVSDALEELRRCSGTQLDEEIVRRFISTCNQW